MLALNSSATLPRPCAMHCDLLIINATLLADPSRIELQERMYLAIRNGVILANGSMQILPDRPDAGQTIDARGGVVMPGLVNGHTHAAMTLFRGLADDLPLMSWLQEHIFPAEAAYVDEEMVYWCSKLAAAEMIMAGTTTLVDGYFHEDAAALAFADAGIRAVAAQGIIDFPAPGVADPAGNIQAGADFLGKWQGRSPLVTPALFCHSPYTCGGDTLRRAKDLARSAGVCLCIHVAETAQEVAGIREQHGLSPVGLLQSLGLLDTGTVCIHGVWLTCEDIAILKETGAGVVTCPESNMKLAAGVAPLPALLAAGIPVGLGTDGCASNNDLDLFQEMGMCARLHKGISLDPACVPAARVLEMATTGGAQLFGLGGTVGRLAPGMRADCIIVDRTRPGLTPLYNAHTLVYAGRGSDVSTVIIDGRVVMQERLLLAFDLRETMAEVRRLSRRIKSGI